MQNTFDANDSQSGSREEMERVGVEERMQMKQKRKMRSSRWNWFDSAVSVLCQRRDDEADSLSAFGCVFVPC
jgi:hypothetical protein